MLRGATVCSLLPASADDETLAPGSLDELASHTRLGTMQASLLNGMESDGVSGTLWQAILHADIELKPGRDAGRKPPERTAAPRFRGRCAPSSDTIIPQILEIWLRQKIMMHLPWTISAPVAKTELRGPSRLLLDTGLDRIGAPHAEHYQGQGAQGRRR